MRLLALDGRQVGHWTAPLQLAFSRRVTVVLGDNEAGKSTLRRAIRGLLFGVDKALAAPLTVAGFDLAGTVEHEGISYSLHRRGQRMDSPLSPELARWLDKTQASRFGDLFYLSTEALLPADGSALLKPDGLVGSLIFAARTGLSPLRLQSARKSIDDALKSMKSRAAGGSGFPSYAERFQLSHQRREELARFDARNEANGVLVARKAEVDRLETELGQLDTETRRLDSLLGGLEDLTAWQHAHAEFSALTDGGTPPPVSVASEFERLADRLRERVEERERRDVAAREALEAVERTEDPGQLHELSGEVEDANAAIVKLTAEEKELARQLSERPRLCDQLRGLIERSGGIVDGDLAEAAKAWLRPEPLLARISALLRERAELDEAVRGHQLLAQQAEKEHGIACNKAESLERVDPAPLEQALRLATGARELEAEAERLRREQGKLATAMDRLLAPLHLAQSPTSPRALGLPAREVALEAEATLADCKRRRQEARAERDRVAAEYEKAGQRIATMRESLGDIPSDRDIEDAKAQREAKLDEIASLCAPGTKATTKLLEAIADETRALRVLLRDVDELLMRRAKAGEALGKLGEAERQHRKREGEAMHAERQLELAEEAFTKAKEALASLWSFLANPPDSADRWFTDWGRWCQAWETSSTHAYELADVEHRMEVLRRDAIHTARAALPELADELSARTLEETIKREKDRMVGLRAQADALQARKVETEARRHEALAVLERSREAMSSWEQRWTATMETLPPALGRDPAAVARWIELQVELRRDLERLGKLDDDIGKRKQRMEGLRTEIASFLAAVRERDPRWSHPLGASPAHACRLAIEAVRGSTRQHTDREGLIRTAGQATKELERAEQEFVAARKMLQERWQSAGLNVPYSPESLHRIVDQAKLVEDVEKRKARSLVALRTRWGERIDACAQEIETSGVSTLEARRADLRRTLADRKKALDEARNLRRDAESALERMAQQHDTPAIEQEYATAREAILDKAAEWYRLRVAEILLAEVQREASEGNRELEERASQYFRALTGKAYDGLRIDHENPAAPQLLAIESTRSEKQLEELSTGTRDQIWLALRLAAAVAAGRETPYPLLLDDTLVQFDDTRTRHALELLHRISEHVQVILFTHHDRVADVAEETIPAADLAVVILPGVTGDMRKRAAKRGTTTLRERPAPVERGSDGPLADILGLEPQDVALNRTRRRQRGEEGRESAKETIVEVLARSSSLLGKAEVLEAASAIGIDLEPHWTQAIKELVTERRVRMHGARKGASYELCQGAIPCTSGKT